MLQLISNLNLCQRIDLSASAWTLASGVTGTFVSFGGNGDVKQPTAGDFAVPIWNESYRNGLVGWSPDVLYTKQLTVLYGKLRGKTDQFTGNPAVNQVLYVDVNGKLTTTAAGKNIPIAICTAAPTTVTYLSTQYSAIEFVTL